MITKRKALELGAFGVLGALAFACGVASGSGSTGATTTTVTTTQRVTQRATQPGVRASVTPAPAKATPPAARPAASVAPAATIEDGTWTVGEDFPPGTYRSNGVPDAQRACYWSITKAGSNGEDILSNDIVTGGRPKVTLKRGQEFETNRCGTWNRVR